MKPFTRFHFCYSFQYIRYALILSVVPLVQAALDFDLESLFRALRQDALIFAAIAVFATAVWLACGYRCAPGRITVREGLVVRRELVLTRPMLAAVELRRPLYCRLLGATQVAFYFKYRTEHYTLSLRAADAAALADELMPVARKGEVFRPVGSERLGFAVVSANVITTGVLTVMSAKRTAEVLGEGFNQLAFTNLEKVEKLIERVLPVGVAWVAALAFVVISLAVLSSFLHTAGFEVCRHGGIIVARGGLVTKTERRILARAVTACDMRVTPIGRLLRRYPVYLQAGGFAGEALPLMVYKKGDEALLQRLMPEFHIAHHHLASLRGRSLAQFLWRPGTFFLLLFALTGVSAWAMPDLAPILSIPLALSFLCLLSSLEGFFTEDIRRGPGRTLEVSYNRFFTRHRVSVFTPHAAFRVRQHPLLARRQRCDVHVYLPGKRRMRARGVPDWQAHSLPLIV